MIVALTGASGFIGSYIAASLKRRGHTVHALVRAQSRRDHIAASVDRFIEGDQSDPQSQAALCAGAECVIHNAADWDALQRSPATHIEKNVAGSLRLLEQARLGGAEQFIFVSSVAALHEILPGGSIDENHPTWPGSLYGAYKASVEPFLKAYHHTYGMNTSSWRPAAVYGIAPTLRDSQWFDLIDKVRKGQPIATPAGGKITHVEDVADALAFAAGDASVAGQFFNLAERYIYWQDVAQLAKDLTGSASIIEPLKGDGPKNQFQTGKITAFFDRHNHPAGLRRGIDGVRAHVSAVLNQS